MLTSLALLAALSVPPGAQVMGPGWIGQHIQATGTVIAEAGQCRQLAVDRQGIPGAGGRLWVCAKGLPDMRARIRVSGEVTDTHMTRMGPWLRPVPVVYMPDWSLLKVRL